MLTREDRAQYIVEIRKLRAEVQALRDELNKLDSTARQESKARYEQRGRIRELISQARAYKKERDFLTGKVKELKAKRLELNSKVSQKAAEVKKAQQEIKSMGDAKTKENPAMLMKSMQRLEYKIETEVLSMDKEKQIMKEIKGLKSRLAESSKFSAIYSNLRKSTDELRHLKKEADEVHKSIQENASKSQELHNKMIEISTDIDNLKEEKSAEKTEEKSDTSFREVNEKLKEKLMRLNELNKTLDHDREMNIQESKKREIESLKEKHAEVSDKIKKRKKLTTEDILVFQQTEEDRA